MNTNVQAMNFATVSPDEIRSILNLGNSDIQQIALARPDFIMGLINQHKMDQQIYGALPNYIVVNTNAGPLNTTIKYRTFINFLEIWEKRPDLIGTDFAKERINNTPRGVIDRSKSPTTVDIFGVAPEE